MSAAHPVPLARPGTLPVRVGVYPVRGLIGAGSVGAVMLGHDMAADRPVAIRTIPLQQFEAATQSRASFAKLEAEVQAARRLDHRHIAAVHGCGEDAGCVYIATEYVRGHSLLEYLRRPERFTTSEAVSLLLQLLDALHHAHEHGVVHRAIRPSNLLIDHEGQLKVTDFGIPRGDSSQATRSDAQAVATAYLAPEQYAGDTVDHRADLFAAGVVLYQLLAGVEPFPGSGEALIHQVVYGQHEPLARRRPSAGLAAYDRLLDAALAKAPADRIATALQFHGALRNSSGGAVAARLAPDRLLAPRRLDTLAVAAAPRRTAGDTDIMIDVPSPARVRDAVGWNDDQIARIEHELALHVGPLAKVIVRRATQGQTDLEAVRQRAAEAIEDRQRRDRFLAAVGASGSATVASRDTTRTGNLPLNALQGDAAFQPQDADRAVAILARAVGPIAKVLVKRCAQGAVTRRQFVDCVLEQLASRADAGELETALWRGLS